TPGPIQEELTRPGSPHVRPLPAIPSTAVRSRTPGVQVPRAVSRSLGGAGPGAPLSQRPAAGRDARGPVLSRTPGAVADDRGTGAGGRELLGVGRPQGVARAAGSIRPRVGYGPATARLAPGDRPAAAPARGVPRGAGPHRRPLPPTGDRSRDA